uniref:Probable protein E5A n=1 Tax=Bos taurus papillomavirus 4 TaxID=10562 RepID=VE5A_BPV4|nr:RecName: Full=Probable protein E5A [Bos taurus papillomavirus 4]
MQHCILILAWGKCILKAKFFLPLLPVRFVLGDPEDNAGTQTGDPARGR